MKLLAVTLALVALPTLAFADDASAVQPEATPTSASAGRTEVFGAVMVGTTLVPLDLGAALEGTYQLSSRLPIYARGRVAFGYAYDLEPKSSPDTGLFVQALAGLEARGCLHHETVCLIGGANVGYELAPLETVHQGPLIGGDVGLEVGGDRVRVRLVLDRTWAHDSAARSATGSLVTLDGGSLSLGAGFRF